ASWSPTVTPTACARPEPREVSPCTRTDQPRGVGTFNWPQVVTATWPLTHRRPARLCSLRGCWRRWPDLGPGNLRCHERLLGCPRNGQNGRSRRCGSSTKIPLPSSGAWAAESSLSRDSVAALRDHACRLGAA